MDKPQKPMTKREKRRRLMKKENEVRDDELTLKKQNSTGSREFKIKARKVQALSRVVRRDTFTVPRPRNGRDAISSEDNTKTYEVQKNEANLIILSDPDDSKKPPRVIIPTRKSSTSTESKNLTYKLENGSEESGSKSKNYTYEIRRKSSVPKEEAKPIPAPRRSKSNLAKEQEKVSDTDEDIMDIELDDAKEKSEKSEKSGKSDKIPALEKSFSSDSEESVEAVIMPQPAPRKKTPQMDASSPLPVKKSRSLEDIEKEELCPRDVKSDVDILPKQQDFDEDSIKQKHRKKPLSTRTAEMDSSLSDEMSKSKHRKNRRLTMSELLDRKNKKKSASKMFSTMIKLEKAKLPKISSILKEFKEESSKDSRNELNDDDRTDFQMDSPRIPESDHNGKIYVQNKNGFYCKTKEEVFKNQKSLGGLGDDGVMEDSTIRTAILFQKYWSRLMTCFHGILAGFALFHAVCVTALMVYHKHDAKGFVQIYSCLALKIHFMFYVLIVLCLISCFDRLDLGHLSRVHYEKMSKLPFMWFVLLIYFSSLVLTFVNHDTEARIDAHDNGDADENLWDPEVHKDLEYILKTWYRMIWARDIMLMLGWYIISLTEFTDHLFQHLMNMVKYGTAKEGSSSGFHEKLPTSLF